MGSWWRLMMVSGLVLMVGCGSAGSSRSTTDQSGEGRPFPWLKGPAREFLKAGSANSVPTFGEEATTAERAQANRVIQGWMRARAATEWARDCSYFSRRYVKALVAEDATLVTEGRVKTCPQALAYFGPSASGNYKNTLSGPIDSLRIEGDQAFALYHGRDGRDWSIPMNREDGKWWVSIAAPVEGEK